MWGWLAPIALTLGGTWLATNANNKAAEINRAAIAQEQQRTDAITKQTAPAQAYLRQVVATPDELTPSQQQALEDNRRSIANTIHSSPFAGSGRTAVALFKRNDSDFINSALDTNRQRALTAANTLSGQGNAAALKSADLTGKIGSSDAAQTIANGQVMGKALGDIGSLIASDQRASRYSDRMSAIEKSLGLNSNG